MRISARQQLPALVGEKDVQLVQWRVRRRSGAAQEVYEPFSDRLGRAPIEQVSAILQRARDANPDGIFVFIPGNFAGLSRGSMSSLG